MSDSESRALRDLLLSLLPEDGTAIGNKALREALAERLGEEVDEARYFAVREPLIEAGLLLKGQGRGGSVRLATARSEPVLNLEAQAIPDAAKQPKPQQAGLKLGVAQAKPKRARVEDAGAAKVLAYRHDQTRINNPEVGMVTPDTDAEERARRWAYDPHIDPALSFDVGRAGIERLIDDALASGEVDTMREALATLKRMAEPYLNWAGKAERTRFEIDTVTQLDRQSALIGRGDGYWQRGLQ